MTGLNNRTQNNEITSEKYTAPEWAVNAIKEGVNPADKGIVEAFRNSIIRYTKLAAGAALMTAEIVVSSAVWSAVAAENPVAECISAAKVKYQPKIDTANAEGNSGKAGMFEKSLDRSIDTCKTDAETAKNKEQIAADKGQIAADKGQIALLEKQIAENERLIKEYMKQLALISSEKKIYTEINSVAQKYLNQGNLTNNDINILERWYSEVSKVPDFDGKSRFLATLKGILKIFGRDV